MDINDIINIGISLAKDKLQKDDSQIGNALQSILTNSDGNIDLSNILASLSNTNLSDIISSWIGSGENKPIDANGVKELLGEEKISDFAQKLGVDIDSATDALKDILPQIVDKATPEGDSILDSLGGVEGLIDIAKKLF